MTLNASSASLPVHSSCFSGTGHLSGSVDMTQISCCGLPPSSFQPVPVRHHRSADDIMLKKRHPAAACKRRHSWTCNSCRTTGCWCAGRVRAPCSPVLHRGKLSGVEQADTLKATGSTRRRPRSRRARGQGIRGRPHSKRAHPWTTGGRINELDKFKNKPCSSPAAAASARARLRMLKKPVRDRVQPGRRHHRVGTRQPAVTQK